MAESGLSLLKTKLFIPRVRAKVVSRPRLIQRLNAGLGGKFTLISAPAGFGKTTLLAEWIRQTGRRVAWLSLDEGDNTLDRFLLYFITACQTAYQDFGLSALATLQSPSPTPVEAILTDLINQLAEILVAESRPRLGRRDEAASTPERVPGLILVLDDFHTIADSAVHEALNFLIENQPPALHLVISGRADPPWPLGRLRARGEMTELRVGDLRFTSLEAVTFLGEMMGLNLTARDVAALEARTEGWIAGLQMAALSMQGRQDIAAFIRSFTGSNRFVLDYLVEEVLEKQPEEIREFLQCTAILERMNAGLCAAVLDEDSGKGNSLAFSQETLEYLERANIFTLPLDNDRQWYRYHRLFADLLRNRLERGWPERVPVLHTRASRWFEKQGLIAEALNHASSASDLDRMGRLVAGNAVALVYQGELVSLMRWLDSFPPEDACQRPWVCVARAWTFTHAGYVSEVGPALADAEEAIASLESPEEARILQAHIAALDGYIHAVNGDLVEAGRLAEGALKDLAPDDLTTRGFAACLLASCLRWTGQLDAAEEAYGEAIAVSRAAGEPNIIIDAYCDQSTLQVLQGKLHESAASCRQALQVAEETIEMAGRRLPGTGYAYTRMADVLREWNDMEAGCRYAREGVNLNRQWGQVDVTMRSLIEHARVLQASGQPEEALAAIRESRSLAMELSDWYRMRTAAWEACLQLDQGQTAPVFRWAEEVEGALPAEIDFSNLIVYLILARVFLAQGKTDAARLQLDRLEETTRKTHADGCLIEVLVLQALASQGEGNLERACNQLEEALTLAEPEGYRRVFLDGGSPVGILLQRLLDQGSGVSEMYLRTLLEALAEETTQGRPAGRGEVEPAPPAALPGASLLVEPLSEREIEVLRFLQTSLSAPEIAGELYIAPSTVRSHIKSIYGKLGVHRRLEAVGKARELGLL